MISKGRLVFCLVFGFVILINKNGFSQQRFSQQALGKQPNEEAQVQHSPKQSSVWFYRTLEINYVLLNTLDLVTTFYSLDRGAKEVNPISRLYIKNKPISILIKGGATFSSLYFLRKAKAGDKKVAFVSLGFLNILYGLVVRNNFNVLVQLR